MSAPYFAHSYSTRPTLSLFLTAIPFCTKKKISGGRTFHFLPNSKIVTLTQLLQDQDTDTVPSPRLGLAISLGCCLRSFPHHSRRFKPSFVRVRSGFPSGQSCSCNRLATSLRAGWASAAAIGARAKQVCFFPPTHPLFPELQPCQRAAVTIYLC